MAGHSKWAQIKRKKAVTDARRGQLWTKLLKEVTVAARLGGGDPDGNPRLRTAVQESRSSNVPNDNIDRAIKRGTGELEGVSYEEVTYEGYGPGGVAILVEVVTDNRNRSVAEIRHLFAKSGGNLGENGCVAWMFDKKGYFNVEKEAVDEDQLMEVALEAGAEDIREEDNSFEVITAPEDFDAVKAALEGAAIPFGDAEVTMLPQNMSPLEGKEAERMLKLMDAMDDCDDVQKVYTNADIPDEMVDAM